MTANMWQLDLFEQNRPWYSVDDRVMGGISQSAIGSNEENELIFLGEMSTANNGGFASIRRDIMLPADKVPAHAKLKLIVQGDGRTYQVRFRTSTRWDAIAYFARIETFPNQTVTHTLSIEDFAASWRGRAVRNASPLRWQDVQQISVMITDKQPGEFDLRIKEIKWLTLNDA